MNDLLGKAVGPAVTVFAVMFVLSWMARKAKQPVENGTLKYGPEILAVGWISVAVAFGAIIVMFTVDHGGQYWAISGTAALFLLLGVPLLLEGHFTTGQFDEVEITVNSVLKAERVARWADLQTAKFEKSGQDVDLLFANGTKIRLNKFMRGLDSVLDHVESIGVDVVGRPHA